MSFVNKANAHNVNRKNSKLKKYDEKNSAKRLECKMEMVTHRSKWNADVFPMKIAAKYIHTHTTNCDTAMN